MYIRRHRPSAVGRLFRVQLFVVTVLAYTCSAQYLAPTRLYDLNAMRGNPFPNVLGLFDIAIDGSRGLAYCTSTHTPFITVIDVGTGTVVRTLDYSRPKAAAAARIDVNPRTLMLLLRDATEPSRLKGINALSGSVVAEYVAAPGLTIEGLAIDEARNKIFLTDGTPIIRVLDGSSLRQMDSIIFESPGAGALAFDSTHRELWAVSIDVKNGRILYRGMYSEQPYTMLKNLSLISRQTAGQIIVHPVDQRIVLVGASSVFLVSPAGVLEKEIPICGGISDAVQLNRLNRLFLVDGTGFAAEGEHGATGKIHIIDIESKRHDSLRAGQGLTRIAADQRSARLLANSRYTNAVIILDGNGPSIMETVDVGESAESLAYDHANQELYVADRLGDWNAIARIGLLDGSVQTLRSGSWPANIVYHKQTHSLIALDHLQSTLSVFGDYRETPSSALRLDGVPEARTEDLGDLRLDESSGLLLICIPEFSRWFLIDGHQLRIIHTGPVMGHSFTRNGRKGQLQGALLPNHDTFAVLALDDRRLTLYSISGGTPLREVDLSALDWSRMRNTEEDVLHADPVDGIIYVGPFGVDALTGKAYPPFIAGSSRLLGIAKDRNTAIGLAVEDDSVRLLLHRLTPPSENIVRSLYPFVSGSPVAYFDQESSQLFLAEPDAARVRQYDFSGIVGVQDIPSVTTAWLGTPYPNPVAGGGMVTVPVQPGSETGREHCYEIIDALGRVVRQGDTLLNAGRIVLSTAGLSPGLYVLRITMKEKAIRKFFIVH